MGMLVFGSFVADLTSRSKGLPKPGETLLGTSFALGPGGKGSNQAVAAHRAGADVVFVTKVGDDAFGRVALDFYKNERMRTDRVIVDPELTTGAAVIMVDELTGQNKIVVTIGACGQINGADLEACRAEIEACDIFLAQLEVNFDALYRAMALAHGAGARVVLNPAPAAALPDEALAMVDTITPNETEAEKLTGVSVRTLDDARRASDAFFRRGVRNVVITLGGAGAFASDGTKSELIPCIPVTPVDTTGAGDAFNGALATALCEGRDLFEALRFGNAAGALCVTRSGTAGAMPTRGEIDGMFTKYYG